MSTNIKGWRFDGTMDEFWIFIQNCRRNIHDIQDELANQLVAKTFFHHADDFFVLSENKFIEEFRIFDYERSPEDMAKWWKKSPITASVDEVITRYRLGEKSDTNMGYNNDYDLSLRICFFPLNTKILVTCLGNYKLRDWFVSHPELKPYDYWNSTDKPVSISDEEWNKRKADWDKAIYTGIPMTSGLEACIIGGMEAYPYGVTPEILDAHAPSLEERIERIAYQKLFNDALEAISETIPQREAIQMVLKLSQETHKFVKDKWDEFYKFYSDILPTDADTVVDNLKKKLEET